jgi:uncharacterized protein (DUF2147 family)
MRFSFVLAAMLLLATSASVEAQRASFGVWKNPQDSVHVRAQPCGSRMCGVVVWASDKAKADARRGGTNDLVGLILFLKRRACGAAVFLYPTSAKPSLEQSPRSTIGGWRERGA